MGLSTNTGGMVGQAMQYADSFNRHLASHTELLTKLVAKSYVEAEAEEYKWLKGTGTTDSNGNATITLDNRTGYEMELVSWAGFFTTTATGGKINFYLHDAQAPNLFWTKAATEDLCDKFARGVMIPVNGVVVAQFSSTAPASQAVWINVVTRRVVHRQSDPYGSHPKGW